MGERDGEERERERERESARSRLREGRGTLAVQPVWITKAPSVVTTS